MVPMTYMTIRATVRHGKVELLDDITLPEDATLLATVLDELERRDLSNALVTLCAGGGMGIATIVERV